MRIFSGTDMENPGDCSPSLSVVSKMRTMSMALSHCTHITRDRQVEQIYNSCEFYKMELYQMKWRGLQPAGFGPIILQPIGCIGVLGGPAENPQAEAYAT